MMGYAYVVCEMRRHAANSYITTRWAGLMLSTNIIIFLLWTYVLKLHYKKASKYFKERKTTNQKTRTVEDNVLRHDLNSINLIKNCLSNDDNIIYSYCKSVIRILSTISFADIWFHVLTCVIQRIIFVKKRLQIYFDLHNSSRKKNSMIC